MKSAGILLAGLRLKYLQNGLLGALCVEVTPENDTHINPLIYY